MGLSDFMAQTEAQSKIVTFGRDLQTYRPTTLEITENGEYDVRYYAKVDVNVEGNPNHKETLTGTCNSFVLPEGFATDMEAGDASMSLIIDATTIGFGEIPVAVQSISGQLQASFSAISSTLEESVCVMALWDTDGSLLTFNAIMGGMVVDLSSSASTIGYTATLYYHKMPDEA